MQALRHYLLAVQFFTRIPVTGRLAAWVGYSPDMLRASAAHFPGIGWLAALLSTAVYAALHWALAQDERLMRFTFPERPGALLKFLSLMQPTWNISLFHYRNQGADYGRILVGMQVPAEDAATFDAFLATLGYPYVEETLNPAYRLFLRSK